VITRGHVEERERDVRRREELAHGALARWLPPGTHVVFAHGGMKPAEAVVIGTSTLGSRRVRLRSLQTGKIRWVPWNAVMWTKREGGES
jgi:hypothetical protein